MRVSATPPPAQGYYRNPCTHRHTTRLISPSAITQKWLQGFSMTCCLHNFPLSHACQLYPVALVTVVPFPSAATPPVNPTPRSERNRISMHVIVCVRNMIFSCLEPSSAGDSHWVPSEQFHTEAHPQDTTTVLQGTCQHREHKTATSFFLTLYFRCLQG